MDTAWSKSWNLVTKKYMRSHGTQFFMKSSAKMKRTNI